MRLLVYGGNQYSERRRIGDWPEAIAGQTLQNKYGLSELYAAFGVGLLDESPFLIYRVMQVYNQRSYPLTLLLDPGARVWEEFDWNGAALMLALFGADDSPGRTLLQEPERYHSAGHLETLFEGVERKAPPGVEGRAARLFLQVWAGTVLEASPVVVGPSEETVGLDSRPSLQEAVALLEVLPPSLRCGRGWLMGGNASYAVPFGVSFIFDNGKSAAPDSDEVKHLLAVRERGAKFLELLNPSDKGQSGARADLLTLTRQPVFLWEKHLSYPFASVIADINLLTALNDEAATSDAPSIRKTGPLDEKFRKVNERLAARGPLSHGIAAAAFDMILNDTGTLTRQQTIFALDQIMKSGAKRINKSIAPRIDAEAAFEFFVNKRIYPSAAGAKMPEPLRAPVCRRLVETEDDAGRLPLIISREAPHISREGDELRGLVDQAVSLSGASECGLGVWVPYFADPEIGEVVSQYVQTYARLGLKEISRTTLGNYLHFGADAGGKWLDARYGADGAEAVHVVIDFMLDELGGDPGGSAQRSAAEWLTKLAHTDLRPRVGIEEKVKIGAALGGDWANLLLLKQTFQGEGEEKQNKRRKKKGGPTAAAPEAGELRYLAAELRDLAARHRGAPLDFVPDLERLYSMLGAEHLGDLVGSLAEFAPPLSHPAAAQWVNGWRKLSEVSADRELSAVCREKYEAEWIRQLLESKAAPVSAGDVAAFGEQKRRLIFQELLFGGGEETDELRRAKLVGLLKADKDLDGMRDAVRGAYDTHGEDAAKRETLLRRYGRSPEAVKLLTKALDASAAEELRRWLEQKSGEALRETTARLRRLLHSAPPENYLEQLNAEKLRADVIDKTLFAQALDRAFADTLETNGDGDPTVFDASPEALRLIKRHLAAENARLLDERLDARVHTREAQSLERLLYDPAEDDEAARRSLTEALKMPSSAVEEILCVAVEKGLDEAGHRKVMFRRLAPPDAINRAARSDLLSGTERLFERLPEALRGWFVEELFQHYGGEKNEDSSVFLAIAYGAFRDLQHEIDGGDGRESKGPKTLKGRSFSDTLLRFVSANEFARNRLATWAFGESPQTIDRYLSDYPRKWAGTGAPSKTSEQALAEEPPANDDGDGAASGAASAKSFLRRLKRVLSDK